MRYYVYVLIDPKHPTAGTQVFYVGKGTGRRPHAHIAEAGKFAGASTAVILDEEVQVRADEAKLRRIQALKENSCSHLEIVRVVARDLSDSLAKTIESYLIKFAYDSNVLTNRVSGAHPERFRAYDDWAHVMFEGQVLRDYYVYALRDPVSGYIIYVGKGKGERLYSHFYAARENREDAELGDKLAQVRRLLEHHDDNDIARVLANGLTEEEAFALESLTLKFLVGHAAATNAVRGHDAVRFRARGDWQLRLGFDLPYIVNAGDGRLVRREEMDGLLGEGLAEYIAEAAALVTDANFEGPAYVDSADLSLFTDAACGRLPVGIKLFARNFKGMQVEVRALSGGAPRVAKDWVDEHCALLGYINRRNDGVFFPDGWHRSLAVTKEEAARRVRLLREWLCAGSREDLVRRVGADAAEELLFVNVQLRAQLQRRRDGGGV